LVACPKGRTWIVFENNVLRRIFGPKEEEVMGLEKLHDEDVHNLFFAMYC
jgi:hypothetical protein